MLTNEQLRKKYGSTQQSSSALMSDTPANQGNVLDRAVGGVNAVYEGYKNFPGIKQATQLVGLGVGASGGVIGGVVGTIGGGVRQLINIGNGKKADFNQILKDASDTARSTAQFGFNIGKEGASAAPLGAAGKLITVPLGLSQTYQGAKDTYQGVKNNNIEQAVTGGIELGTGLFGLKSAVKTKGLIVSKAPEKTIVKQRVNELTKIENRNQSIRNVIQSNAERGIDVKKIVSETDLLKDAVDRSGVIRTSKEDGAISQLQEFIKPQEKVISNVLKNEGKSIALDYLEKRMKLGVYESGVEGGALTRALKNVDDDIAGYRLKADASDAVPLSLVQDAKIDKYRNINYLNPESKRVDKAIAKALKETVEDTTSSADVKALNQELSRHYAVLDFLEKLDGKTVAGGKLGKYFASTIGAVAGSKFGPLGTIVGAEVGSMIKGLNMASKFRGAIGKSLQQSVNMQKALRIK